MRLRQASVVMLVAGVLSSVAVAQGTKQWTVDQYDAMERGRTEGVAIRSDGELEPGPATSLLYQTTGNYVWSLAADRDGEVYIGMGGTGAAGAQVMKIAGGAAGDAAGKTAVKVFAGKELAVQALRVASDGRVYAATSPDGKVYRLGATPADAAMVFDPAQTPEKPKYLWDLAFSPDGREMYVAAGAPAAVYRVPLDGGKPELAFKTADQHVRCLLMAANGTLWAGTDGEGVIYSFDTKTAGARPMAAYAAPKREITSLAMDSAGNVYAAGVGTRPAAGTAQPALPPLPVTGNVGVTITFSQPGSTNAATANSLVPEGSEIYRIAPDGSPERLVALKDDVVYALAFDDGALLAATGNRGHVYRVDVLPASDAVGRYTDVAHLEAGDATVFAAVRGGQVVGTSNSGKVYRLEDKAAANATYTSEVFDAGEFARWGRLEVQPAESGPHPTFDLFERTGNVENPVTGWSDWMQAGPDGTVAVPQGRFAQWKAVLRAGAAIDSVSDNYLQKNIAPVVDEIVVQPGARVAAAAAAAPNNTVQVNFPAPGSGTPTPSFTPDTNTQPLTAQKDRTGITVRWAAHDDNDDELMFAVWYRGVGEKNWRLLKDKISERYLSFDASLLPDGQYEVKVVASDAPDHTDADTLTGERVSGSFLVDTTPPVPGTLVAAPGAKAGAQAQAASGAGAIHAVFSAKDALSPIVRAEYSVDAGPWQFLEPVGKVSDSLEERYDFVAPLSDAGPAQAGAVADVREHVIAIRVYDRNENMVSVKAVVR